MKKLYVVDDDSFRLIGQCKDCKYWKQLTRWQRKMKRGSCDCLVVSNKYTNYTPRTFGCRKWRRK